MTKIVHINGTQIQAQEGQTVLEAALSAGIYIPHLCSHPNLLPEGGCKLCVVEINGEKALSCSTKVKDGLNIVTNSEELMKIRRMSMELMLASHPEDCTSCKSYLKCELQALMQYLSITHSRMHRIEKENTGINRVNPIISRDMNRCIQCGRCVRACRDLRGVGILNYKKKNGEVYIGTEDDLPLADVGCRFCSACVEVCPTGALLDAAGVHREDMLREQALIPCKAECPAHIDVPAYVRYIRNGELDRAVGVIRAKSPFVQVLGYVCNHACETGCKRGKLDAPVSICALKRYAGTKLENKPSYVDLKKPATQKKVAVIGGGPAGLTAAYYLALMGHEVTLFERKEKAGGQMQFGIPAYRLPKDVVQKEVSDILRLGIDLRCNSNISNPADLLQKGYHAVVVAVGVSKGAVLPIPGHEAKGVYTALDILAAANRGKPIPNGRNCFIIGGGSVAFDTARALKRLGAETVTVACLEDREHMPSTAEEIAEAKEEEILVYPAKSFLRITQENGTATGVETMDVASLVFDGNKLLRPETVEGSNHVYPADMVVFAVGQKAEPFDAAGGFETGRANTLIMEDDGSCRVKGHVGVFAAGDVVTGIKFVITGIAAGRQAAAEVDKYLGGDGEILSQSDLPDEKKDKIGKLEGFASLPREKETLLDVGERKMSFACVKECFSEEQACRESERCLQCDLRTKITKTRVWTSYGRK